MRDLRRFQAKCAPFLPGLPRSLANWEFTLSAGESQAVLHNPEGDSRERR